MGKPWQSRVIRQSARWPSELEKLAFNGRSIMASQRPVNPPSLYPLLLLQPRLPFATLGYPPASSFCLQCYTVSWENEKDSLPHIEWSSSASRSTCKCIVWLLKPLSSRSAQCPREFNSLRTCRQQCSAISKAIPQKALSQSPGELPSSFSRSCSKANHYCKLLDEIAAKRCFKVVQINFSSCFIPSK